MISGLPALGSAGLVRADREPDLGVTPAPTATADLDAVLDSGPDLWGEAAMRGPGEPDFAFFADLLPPLRYVDAAFRHYPIVLSGPGAPLKARLVSNGSAINAKAKLRSWKEFGYPVTFHVGDRDEVFGHDVRRLEGPRYVEGFLPVVRTRYQHLGSLYEQEVFASTAPPFSQQVVVFVRFTLLDGPGGSVDAHIRVWGPLVRLPHAVRDDEGRLYLWLGPNWRPIDRPQRRHLAELAQGESAVLAVISEPGVPDATEPLSEAVYAEQRGRCMDCWRSLLDRGIKLDVPEPVVNRAWRSLVVGTFVCARGDVLNYSAGNAYERQYVAECGDAVRALLMYGYRDEARRMIPPLFDHSETITKKRIGLHNAGFALQLLAHYYWLTRDASFVLEQKPRWSAQADLIVRSREPATGLLPRENYAGDIFDQVYSLNTNSNCWRGLRDLGAVLRDAGAADEADALLQAADELREATLRAVRESERMDVSPPFIPNALRGEEEPYDRIAGSVMGSYWNLIIPYVLGSGILGYDSERTGWILDYLHQRGGLCMGMPRVNLYAGDAASDHAVDDLYGLRYVLTLLKRDEVERALVSFYGKLAQGLTRDTFIGAECTSLVPADDFGRPMGLPPNTASNALFLWMLRYLLVQDWDLDDDGVPETLRLLFATPRAWLGDGQAIRLRNAPTAFGPIDVEVESRLAEGVVVATVTCPPVAPDRMLLRVRLPTEVRVSSATVDGEPIPLGADATLDLTGRRNPCTIRLSVQPRENEK